MDFSQLHPPPPTTTSTTLNQHPLSPASSTGSDSDNSQRIPKASKVDPPAYHTNVYPDDANNSPPNSPPNQAHFLAYQNYPTSVNPPPPPPRSPPPEPYSHPNWSSFQYPSSSTRSPAPHQAYDYTDNTQQWSQPRSPMPDSQTNQLPSQLPASQPPVIASIDASTLSPPQSPPPTSSRPSASVTLSPAAAYPPHHPYPVPSSTAASAGSQPPHRTYSFVSLPGNAIKKRPRRRYDEIERLYSCSFEGCNKSYGTLNHLNAHVTMQRHGQKRTPNEFKELRKEWRRQKKHSESDDVYDLPSASGGASSSQASISAKSRRKRRATEPALPSVSSLGAVGTAMAGIVPSQPVGSSSGAEREASYHHQHMQVTGVDTSRRVSIEEYGGDRRGSGGSSDGFHEESLSEDGGGGYEGGGSSVAQSGEMTGRAPGHRPVSPVRAPSPSALLPTPHLPSLARPAGHQTGHFWQQSQQHSESHHPPISPTTTTGVSPHVSQVPGPGPSYPTHPGHAALGHGHPRQPAYPPTYVPSLSQAHPSYPPSIPAPHHPSLPYPHVAPAQPHTPPGSSSHQPHPGHQHIVLPSAPQHPDPSSSLQPQQQQQQQQQPPPTMSSTYGQQSHQSGQSLPLTSPQNLTMPPISRLHPGSTLLTPLNPGHPHRQEGLPVHAPLGEPQTSNPAPSGDLVSPIGLSGYGGVGQGLPSVTELGIHSRGGMEADRGGIVTSSSETSSSLHPSQQQLAPSSYDPYAREPAYPASRPNTGPESSSYGGIPREVYGQPQQQYQSRQPEAYGGSHSRPAPYGLPRSQSFAGTTSYARGDSYTGAPTPEYSIPPPSQRSQYPSSLRPEPSAYEQPPRGDTYGDPAGVMYAPDTRGTTTPYGDPAVPSHSQNRSGHPHDPYASRAPSGSGVYGLRGHPGPSEGGYERS